MIVLLRLNVTSSWPVALAAICLLLQLAIFISQPSSWAMHCNSLTNHKFSQSLSTLSHPLWSAHNLQSFTKFLHHKYWVINPGLNRFEQVHPPSSCLDLELNFGPVLKGSSLNCSSELNCGSTKHICWSKKYYLHQENPMSTYYTYCLLIFTYGQN